MFHKYGSGVARKVEPGTTSLIECHFILHPPYCKNGVQLNDVRDNFVNGNGARTPANERRSSTLVQILENKYKICHFPSNLDDLGLLLR